MPGPGRLYSLLYIDASDTLRPPGLDALVLIVGALGAIIIVLQPFTSPAMMLHASLDPTLVATAIFLALRGAAGVTGLVQNGVMNVYMAYPLSRASIALVLIVSRVIAPAAIILGAPSFIVLFIMWPSVKGSLDEFAASYLAYLAQAVFYGMVFTLIALRTKTPGSSGVLSVAFYFTYTVVGNVILGLIGRATGRQVLADIGDASYLPALVTFYYAGGEDFDAWQFAMVPAAIVVLMAATLIYFMRRFEPS